MRAYRTINLPVKYELHRELKRLSFERDVSLAYIVRRAIADYLKKVEEGEKTV